MSKIYISKTFIYSKRNIAGFELRDEENTNFRELLHYEETIEYIKSIGGRIKNAEVYLKNKNYLGKEIYDIRSYGDKNKSFLNKEFIFNLNVLYNERGKFYEEYRDLFNKFICVMNI